MKFYDYLDHYKMILSTITDPTMKNILKQHSMDEFYDSMKHVATNKRDPFAFRHSMLEKDWINNNRPYYNIYPAIIPMVNRLKLNIPCSYVNMPEPVLLLRLPESDHNPYRIDDTHCIKTILFGVQPIAREKGSKDLVNGLTLAMDVGEYDNNGLIIHTFKCFPLREDMTIEEAAIVLPFHHSWATGFVVPEEMIVNMIKLCCCVCLIGKDPELVSPDVLAKDRHKLDGATEEQLQRLVEKAKKRGKNGYDLGKDLEMCPHYRSPHLAIVWTGKGRVLPKLVKRKGSVVHRDKITTIPTGHIDQYDPDSHAE